MEQTERRSKQPKSPATPAAPASQIKENAPMSTNPAPSHDSTESRGPAVIGKSVMIKGQIFSREDLTIDGRSMALSSCMNIALPSGRMASCRPV